MTHSKAVEEDIHPTFLLVEEHQSVSAAKGVEHIVGSIIDAQKKTSDHFALTLEADEIDIQVLSGNTRVFRAGTMERYCSSSQQTQSNVLTLGACDKLLSFKKDFRLAHMVCTIASDGISCHCRRLP